MAPCLECEHFKNLCPSMKRQQLKNMILVISLVYMELSCFPQLVPNPKTGFEFLVHALYDFKQGFECHMPVLLQPGNTTACAVLY